MRFIFTLLFGLSCTSILAHDIHVSVTEITVQENQTLDISLRIFFDDLLLACGLQSGEPIPDTYSSSDELIEEYVNTHFKLYNDEQQIELFYVESFTDNMAVWVELKTKSEVISNTDLTIVNTILLKEFDDQLNILNWVREQKTSSVSFTHKKRKTTIQV
jgi:hypothetical protein